MVGFLALAVNAKFILPLSIYYMFWAVQTLGLCLDTHKVGGAVMAIAFRSGKVSKVYPSDWMSKQSETVKGRGVVDDNLRPEAKSEYLRVLHQVQCKFRAKQRRVRNPSTSKRVPFQLNSLDVA